MKAPNNLNRFFDHTILKPSSNWEMVEKICREAVDYRFYSVCVNPVWIQACADYFKKAKADDVSVCTVIGFPLGANTTDVKLYEIERAILDGADELDVVINVGKLKDGESDFILNELTKCKLLTGDKVLKVIIETSLLSEDEKKLATKLVMDSGSNFVKTSTGFAGGGATVEDICLMKSIVGDNTKIKASGGVRDLDFTLKLIEAGANRIGASASVAIMEESKGNKTKNEADGY